MNTYLPFIEDSTLIKHVTTVLTVKETDEKKFEKLLYKNVIDPFSAIFDASIQNITLHEWLIIEKKRQVQKTLQNKIGEFHQSILGSVVNWKSLPTGNVIDLINKKGGIIAEIKNKYNTMKGDSKVKIYDSLFHQLTNNYPDYTAYYVEIIPKANHRYNKPFTPSDNTSHTKRTPNEKIRIIDGKSFYHLVTGYENGLDQLYLVLPKVISKIKNLPNIKIYNDSLFKIFFDKVYSEK